MAAVIHRLARSSSATVPITSHRSVAAVKQAAAVALQPSSRSRKERDEYEGGGAESDEGSSQRPEILAAREETKRHREVGETELEGYATPGEHSMGDTSRLQLFKTCLVGRGEVPQEEQAKKDGRDGHDGDARRFAASARAGHGCTRLCHRPDNGYRDANCLHKQRRFAGISPSLRQRGCACHEEERKREAEPSSGHARHP